MIQQTDDAMVAKDARELVLGAEVRAEVRAEPRQAAWRKPGGVLHRLHDEAQARRDAAAIALAAERARRERVAQALARPLALLQGFFRELASALADAAPEIERDYAIPGAGRLDGLRQVGYRVSALETRAPGAFRFAFRCESRALCRFTVERARLRRLEQRLLELGLRPRVFDRGHLGAGFVLEARVPVALDFAPDLERPLVAVTATNLGALGAMRYRLAPELIDATFMDELAKVVLGEPSRFAEISGNSLSEEARARLRQRLDAERRDRPDRRETRMSARVARWLGL